MKKIFLVLAMVGLSGCATSAVTPEKAKLVPENRVFAYQKPIENGAELTVIRDSGFLGGGCFYGFYINQQRVASLDSGEKANFNLPAGEYILGFKGEGRVCIADNFLNERELSIKEGQRKGVRLFADPSGNLDIKPISL
ncbi:TPA: hypothetical protein OUC63_003842 [Raoultella ornithinolytica]|uniref:hypothetical protein n=1 Tax=Klebsiella TaxID=570 RepID=UPI000E34BFE9|nr:hypothetical protein [Klebsiella pneumoniae]MCZ5603184.1 hypothetical protein [Klebsiella pneumoniae]HCT9585828.1 hypothetical protein [Raoultella ornithinolytica]HDZ0997708.1 hypothetical protein [Klebsiella pneumoniae]